MKPRIAHGYLLVGLLATAFYLLTQGELQAELEELAITLSAILATIVSMYRNRSAHRTAWWVFAFALVVFAAEQVCWIVNIVRGVKVVGPVGNTLDLLGYVVLIVGGVIILRARTRRDAGGVLDSAVLAMASATIIWEFLLIGRLRAVDPSALVLAVNLGQDLVVMGGLAVLLRMAQTNTGARAPLCYFVAAVFCGFIQIVVYPLVSPAEAFATGRRYEWIGGIAVICIGAAALHPAMANLSQPGPAVVDRLTPRRLLLLGMGLLAGPVSVGISLLLGRPADGVLLVVGSIAVVPLVMYRIRGLVSQRAAAEAALAHQALHDSLTGLPNRAHFVSLLEAAVRRVREGTSSRVAVLFCDLDRFKEVNDTLGHAAGDQLLITVASRLVDSVRDNDVVSRFGGDEFLILCENLSEAEVSERICARIVAQIQLPIRLGGSQVRAAASIGVAATSTTGELTAAEIIRDADLAMYAVKHGPSSPATDTRADLVIEPSTGMAPYERVPHHR